LAYAGAALPLLLLFSLSGQSLGTVAIEIVATLVGGIGLVIAVPVSTLLGVLVAPTTGGETHEPDHEEDRRLPRRSRRSLLSRSAKVRRDQELDEAEASTERRLADDLLAPQHDREFWS
jgi:YibE/F-like protein